MKLAYKTLFILVLVGLGLTNIGHAKIKDIVFDLDWTLFYSISEEVAQKENSGVVKVDGKFYRMSDYGAQVISILIQKGYRVSIYSGGLKGRNQKLVKFLKGEIQKYSGERFVPFKILSRSDLVFRRMNEKFSIQFAKDLKKVNPRLEEVVLFDDMKEFSVEGQKANLFWLNQTFDFISEFHSNSPNQEEGLRFVPRNYKDWLLERYKIVSVLGLLFGNEDLTPQELQKIWNENSGKARLVKEGFKILKLQEVHLCRKLF